MRGGWVWIVPGVVLLSAVAVSVRASDDAPDAAWKAWVTGLGASGYRVTQGGSYEVDNAACRKIVAVFGTCFGNNAAAPYVIPQIPIDATAVDKSYAKPFTTPGGGGAPSNMFYRLSDADAAVTIVRLPPQAAYWGFQSYLFTRKATDYPANSDARHAQSLDPGRYEIFGSLGNDINNVVISNRLGAVWDNGTVVYITTSNQELAQALIRDASDHGLDAGRIFVEPVGQNVKTGASLAADDMVTLIRYALPKDAQAGKAWLKAIKSNVQTFRVSAAPGAPMARFDTPSYTRKGMADEGRLTQSLDELTTLLHDWLEEKEGRPILTSDMTVSDHEDENGTLTGLVGANCIEQGQNCLGDNQDTDAYRLGFVGKITATQTIFVAGVNHAVLGDADYVSLAVYNMSDFTGIASASQSNPASVGFDSGTLTGSAEAVLTELGLLDKASARLRKDLPSLYVSLVSRDCRMATQYCIALDKKTALPSSDRMAVTQRAYVKSGTTTGGSPDRMLTPVVIFRPDI